MKYYKTVATVTLVFFLLISFSFLVESKYFMSLFITLLGIVFYKGINSSAKNKYGKEEDSKAPKKTLPDFHWREIQGKGFQLLESIDIITNTKNFDTLRCRMIFINEIYPALISYSSLRINYPAGVKKSIDRYKEMYYDKKMTDIQYDILLKPNKDTLMRLYADCILECFKRYVEQQVSELNKLKTHAAKEKRRENIIKTGYSAKYMFKEFDLIDLGHLEKIEDIRKKYYSYSRKIE